MKQPYCVSGVAALLLLPFAVTAQVTYNTVPTRILGQAVIQQQITATAPNLAEGRELYFPQAIAVDSSVSPAILYVADSSNNRVLAWKNVATFTNGATADLVIGQRDFYSTTAQGPGRTITYGLSSPTAVAVDGAGNLYVTDAGNNRILRYPRPFSQTFGNAQPDFVIGQTSLNANNANRGLSTPSANSLATTTGNGVLQAGLAFDAGGNLWASDPGNNRVLRYPKASLAGKTFSPAADMVLGQPGFTTNALPQNAVQNDKTFLAQPAGLAFDQTGDLFVADAGSRVLAWVPPVFSGEAAGRILGVDPPTAQNPNPAAVSAKTLSLPSGVVTIGNSAYVLDTGNNRILGYPPASTWPPEGTSFSPPANVVIGQPDFASSKANQGQQHPSASTLYAPTNAVYTGTDLFVSDANNNRVLDFPVTGGAVSTAATRVLGQNGFQYRALNLIEGREVFFNGTDPALGLNISGAGVAVDTTSNPPHLYISDTGNHRILGFRDARSVTTSTKADIVIGQADLGSNVINYPNNDPNTPTASGLFLPENIVVDVGGNLWVADLGNSRVLRFPTPFAAGHSGGTAQANLVLGQSSFTGPTLTGAAANTMSAPYGIAIGPNGNVYVSDSTLNRVLMFKQPSGDFANGQNAANVFGQPDFFTSTVQAGRSGLNSPRGLAVDNSDRLYVADSGNGRVAIFGGASSALPEPPPALTLSNLSSPNGVAFNPSDGTIWVANTSAGAVLQYPSYNLLPVNPAPSATLSSVGPLAIALDAAFNPVVAEAVNRVAFYYPAMRLTNSANYFPRYAPGMLASLFTYGTGRFGSQRAVFNSVPLPRTLGDVQVLVAGKAAPLLFASQGQINIQIPSSTPLGLQEVDVVRVSTNEVLASSYFQIEASSPGLFTTDATGQGPIAAINVDDGTINSQAHPVKAGHFISLYGTGQGVIPGGPADGTPSQGVVKTPVQPLVYMGGATYIPAADVEYSGLAPGYIGLWQINAKVPTDAAPGPITVFVSLNGANSIQLDTGGNRLTTTIYVAQ
jgi:uncharacterized protein (TIGR03437 family)